MFIAFLLCDLGVLSGPSGLPVERVLRDLVGAILERHVVPPGGLALGVFERVRIGLGVAVGDLSVDRVRVLDLGFILMLIGLVRPAGRGGARSEAGGALLQRRNVTDGGCVLVGHDAAHVLRAHVGALNDLHRAVEGR
ncbi:hypothetical protein [Pseudooceanicola sp.]|uniref:hypothetical protein n=1 Tax=Pseudooceanicola sp. TaxID=1914328 RepID=UPI0035188074